MTILISFLSALSVASSPVGDQDALVVRNQPAAVDLTASAPVEVASPSSTVATATVNAGQPLSTSNQIDRWLSSRTGDEGVNWREEPVGRRMQGEVSLGIGTNDYSHVSGHIEMPLGEDTTLSLGFSQTKNGYGLRPMGVDALFWSPQDEWLGPQWVTPSGRSYSPLDSGRSLIRRPLAGDNRR